MKRTVSGLQRRVGVGGSVTLLALLCLGYPIYLSLEDDGTLLGFAMHDTTIVLFVVMLMFASSALIPHKPARVAQVLVLLLFGYVTLAGAVLGALTGLAIASVGVMLAAHYGYLRRHTRPKTILIVTGTLVSLAIQAVGRSAEEGLSWTALQFSYNAVGVLGLAAGYLVVLRDAATTASRRQAALQEAVDERTRALSREIESRRQAEQNAKESAERAGHLAVERLELLREVHHRAKNSLQMTLTLLEMSNLETPDGRAATINRVRAIGLVYDLIDGAEDLNSIVLQDYLDRLVSHFRMSAEYGPVMIELSTSGEYRTRVEPTINFGLMTHEIVSLICGYAFEFKPGVIEITLEHTAGNLRLILSHKGSVPRELAGDGAEARDGFGLLPAFFERLHCQVTIEQGETTVWRLAIPDAVMTSRTTS